MTRYIIVLSVLIIGLCAVLGASSSSSSLSYHWNCGTCSTKPQCGGVERCLCNFFITGLEPDTTYRFFVDGYQAPDVTSNSMGVVAFNSFCWECDPMSTIEHTYTVMDLTEPVTIGSVTVDFDCDQ